MGDFTLRAPVCADDFSPRKPNCIHHSQGRRRAKKTEVRAKGGEPSINHPPRLAVSSPRCNQPKMQTAGHGGPAVIKLCVKF